MSQTKAHPDPPLTGEHASKESTPAEAVESTATPEAGPPLQPDGTHTRSHAAHLEEGNQQTRTKPEGNLRQGSAPGARRQP